MTLGDSGPVLDKVRGRCAWRGLASALLCAHIALFVPVAQGQARNQSQDLTGTSLEDLMNMQVDSPFRREQKISHVPAAFFVITQEDIRASGALNIPDLLRMVPGLDVAQINAHTWAISARGFNGEFSNKMLVMLDGRSVYTPAFSGVYWSVFDLPLEDIERIEVVRGPGGTAWGANAVNGVINVVTRRSGDTPGLLLQPAAGTRDQGPYTAQYGGKLGRDTSYRFFARFLEQSSMPPIPSAPGPDGWRVLRGGFRADREAVAGGRLMVEGDLYMGRQAAPVERAIEEVPVPVQIGQNVLSNLGGGYLLGEWDGTTRGGLSTTIRASFDEYRRTQVIREDRKTFNLELQQHLPAWRRHDFVWNLAYRFSDSDTRQDGVTSLVPADLVTNLFSAFVQDDVTLVPGRLSLTAGIKAEQNHYTGLGVMPGARLSLQVSPREELWAGISRALRTPSSIDTSILADLGVQNDGGTEVEYEFVGNPKFKDETLVAYEAGWRRLISNRLSVDCAAYYNVYHHLQTLEQQPPISVPAPTPHLLLARNYGNKMHGETHGGEVFAAWRVTRRWILNPSYSLYMAHMHVDPSSNDSDSIADVEEEAPVHQAQLRSTLDLASAWTWSVSAFFSGPLVEQGVPSNTRLDSVLTWRLGKRSQLNFVGQNLMRDRHVEFNAPEGYSTTTQIKRTAYVRLAFWF